MSGHKSIVHAGIKVGLFLGLFHASTAFIRYTPNNECKKTFCGSRVSTKWMGRETRMTHDRRYTSVFQARSIGDKSISLGMLILNPLVAFLLVLGPRLL